MLFMSCICHAFASVHCCLVVTFREGADLLAFVCGVYCDFVNFPFGILGQVWYLIVLIPDPCCLSYFVFAPADKAAINNVVVVSKMYYIYTLKQELSTAKAYEHNRLVLSKIYDKRDHFNFEIVKGYFHLCPRMDFLQTLQINNSLYTNYENVFVELDS